MEYLLSENKEKMKYLYTFSRKLEYLGASLYKKK